MGNYYFNFKHEDLWCILQTTQQSVENKHHGQDQHHRHGAKQNPAFQSTGALVLKLNLLKIMKVLDFFKEKEVFLLQLMLQ